MNNKFAGMTVNERLFVNNKIKDFDKAVKKNDTKKIISILKGIELDEDTINAILLKLSNK